MRLEVATGALGVLMNLDPAAYLAVSADNSVLVAAVDVGADCGYASPDDVQRRSAEPNRMRLQSGAANLDSTRSNYW